LSRQECWAKRPARAGIIIASSAGWPLSLIEV
jgi:hypothetical protein